MATSYHSTPSVIEKKKPLNQKKPFYKKKAVYIILSIVLASVAWYNSDFWPWPSRDRIRERLDKVIDICTDNENSSECKSLQSRYDMTFKYYHSLANSGEKNSWGLPTFPWYAVAWEGKSSTPPDSKMGYGDKTFTMPSVYYGCQDHKQ